MKKLPYLNIAIGCTIFVVLVIARCCVTAWRQSYYGFGAAWAAISRDPWFYIGIVIAVAAVCAWTLWAMERFQKNAEPQDVPLEDTSEEE